jgi:glycolate oxidase iron-sulfur subunit
MQDPRSEIYKLVEKGALKAQPVVSAELLAACIHCGMCLPACPTYLATGRELESPRGRIYLLSLLEKGEVGPEPRLVEHIDSCLGCLGCVSACPSGVEYGKILDQSRPLIAACKNQTLRRLMRFVFSRVLPDYKFLQFLGGMLRRFQRQGLATFVESLPFKGRIWSRLKQWQALTPPVPEHKKLPGQAWQSGEKLGTAQLFAGCVMDVFYNDVNHDCLNLVAAQSYIVQVPEQTCCGALAFHAGEADIARHLAKRNIELFEAKQGDIVVTAAGCGAMLKHYEELFANDSKWQQRAREFAGRVKDITEFLAAHEFKTKPQAMKCKVTYHAACHLAHAQGVRQAPGQLLNQIEGIDLIPLEEAEHCCGSAGIYNLTHTTLSMAVLERKLDYLAATGADIVVTTNPGCLLQLEAGIRQQGLKLKAMHLAQFLAAAYLAD